MTYRKQKGSTMLEVLVASIIFALGILGIANSIVRGVHASVDNNARAIASSVASQQAESLYIAANNLSSGNLTEDQFSALLVAMNNVTQTGNDGRDDFLITVLEARDSKDVDVLTTAAPYTSPIRVVIEVRYQGLNDAKTTRANYTFVW